MWNPLEIRQRYNLRIYLFLVAVVVLVVVLFARMVQLQWVQYNQYFVQSENNRIHVSPILPIRGMMTDRNGLGLAVNKISYKITLIPERVENLDDTLAFIQHLMQWKNERIQRLKKKIKLSRSDRAVLLKDHLTWQSVAPIAARLHHYSGVNVVAATHREYPYAMEAAHIVGYLSLVRDVDVQKGYLRMEYVGRSGLERILEQRLHGELGYQYEEVNARGRRVALIKTIRPTTGENVQLSLDITLQEVAANALQGRTGAVVVLDVHTGEVLTLLSMPGYDSNKFITGLNSAQWKSWLEDVERPLLNRTTQAAYPPASTLKMVTSFGGLAAGLRLAEGSTQCPGYVELADRRIRCWKKRGHGKVDLHDSLVHSCDVYFYEMGDALGMERLSEAIKDWGFGERTGINLPPESRGNVPSKRHPSGRNWYRGETMITAIGQGSTTVTPLQMARFAAAIANGGKILTPLLEKGEPVRVIRSIEVSKQALRSVRQGMRDVVAEPKGTAHWQLSQAKWTVAGKTGTAQVVKISADDKRTFSDAREHQDHAWFMGYAPFEKPEIAFAVFVEHGGHGGSAAGPVARKIVDFWADKMKKEREQDQP
ncbi:MAG: penicillin-binding protein 2 [Ghiorsea sp.]|nr:penicillin-binding protein 2 [Ghiorsea sp.]